MAQEKVTREELRAMRIGQTRIFILMDKKKVTSAKVTTQQLNKEEDLKFMAKPDYEACSISITRLK